MSVNLFYPENADRAKRVRQLIDNIVSIQTSVTQDADRMDEDDVQIRQMLNEVLASAGFATFDELRDKVYESLSEEEKSQLLDTMAEYDKLNLNLQTAYDATLLITFFASNTAIAARSVRFIASGAMYVTSYAMVKTLRALFRGTISIADAASMFAEIAKSSKKLKLTFESTSKIGKAVRVLRIAGDVVFVAGIITDAVLIILAAIEGKKQKEELQAKIVELFETRLSTKMIETLAKDTSYYQASLKSMVRVLNSDWPEERKNRRLEEDAEWLLEDIETLWSKHSYGSIFDLLAQQDANADAWTDEDPSRKDTIEKMESIDDVVSGDEN